MKLEVGAQVRFLDSIGGGRVSRIEKGVVYVEDEDGFEIPTPINKCVVVEQKDTFVPAYKPPRGAISPSKAESLPKADERSSSSEDVPQTLRAAHSYLPAQGEINLLLAYTLEQGSTSEHSTYKSYLINDSDYSLYYCYKIETKIGKRLRKHGLIEPDQILMVDSFSAQEANLRSQYQLHALAFSENPGDYKATYNIDGSLKVAKLFDRKNFSKNEFIDHDAYLVKLVSEGRSQGRLEELNIDALRERMTLHPEAGSHRPNLPNSALNAKQNDVLEIVDLHIEQLIDDLTGSDSSVILNRQLEEFDKRMLPSLRKIGKKLIFIHGRGNGVLRRKLEERLRLRYRGVLWTDAEPSVYAGGAIEITIA